MKPKDCTALRTADEKGSITREEQESKVMLYAYTGPPVEHAIAVGLLKHPDAALGAIDHARTMAHNLLGPEPSCLERLLVDRITACWWRVQQSETAYTYAHTAAGTAQLEVFHKRLERAQRMYTEAILALAKLRKMALPDIRIQAAGQVNVGNQQVNVAEVSHVE